MSFVVTISSTDQPKHESAIVSITNQKQAFTELYFDFSELLKTVPAPTETAQDFLLVATTVYALDKLVARKKMIDGWTRTFKVTIPVRSPKLWRGVSTTINECVSFLSGDEWQIDFSLRREDLIIYRENQSPQTLPQYASGNVACLFSGGLDSLIGAIDWLEENPQESLALVGHHDRRIAGPLRDQTALLEGLTQFYQDRFTSTFVGIGHYGKSAEITMRSRSLLFLALGLMVAEHLGSGTTLLIPENGTIALNVPLTPSRRGSCSTRTTHPHYLNLLRQWLLGIGLTHPLENPLLGKTKGTAVLECKNRGFLRKIFHESVSCAKRGHKSSWINRHAHGCGRCMPCIYRRAALHAAKLDNEQYGVDICNSDVDWTNSDSRAADDFRACLSFLLQKPSQIKIAQQLIASGHLPPLEAMSHAELVQDAMNEIRKLLKDKANLAVRKAAGLT